MSPILPPSAPSESSELSVTRPEPAGRLSIGSQIAAVISPTGLAKLQRLLASTRPPASNDLQIKG